MTQNNRERLRADEAAKAQRQRLNRIIGVGAAVLAVVLIGVFAVVLLQSQGTQATTSSVTPPNATSDGKAVVVNPGKAKSGAPVVELFFDYQCPVCYQFEGLYGAALAALADSGEIELHYRTMTFLDNNLNNDSSLQAGIAATCSDVVGRYAAVHAAIFTNQPATEGDGYDKALLRDTIPVDVGLSGADLKDGITGTPSFHVNGKDVPLASFSGVTADKLGDLITQNA